MTITVVAERAPMPMCGRFANHRIMHDCGSLLMGAKCLPRG